MAGHVELPIADLLVLADEVKRYQALRTVAVGDDVQFGEAPELLEVGAMSGGAVFGGDGFLIGVLSNSIEGPSVWEGGPSYAAWLVPAMPQAFGRGWPPSVIDGSHGFLDDRSFAVVRHADAFKVNREDGTWSYESLP